MDRQHFVKDSLVIVCSSEQVPADPVEKLLPSLRIIPGPAAALVGLKAQIYSVATT